MCRGPGGCQPETKAEPERNKGPEWTPVTTGWGALRLASHNALEQNSVHTIHPPPLNLRAVPRGQAGPLSGVRSPGWWLPRPAHGVNLKQGSEANRLPNSEANIFLSGFK